MTNPTINLLPTAAGAIQDADKMPTQATDTGNDSTFLYTRSWADFKAYVLASLTAASVVNVPAGTISATNVQAAINELDTEKVAKAGDAMTGSLSITSGSGSVLTVTSTSGATLDVTADGVVGNSAFTRYIGNSGGFNFSQRKARGSLATPTVVLQNDFLGQFQFSGYGGAGFVAGASFVAAVIEPTPSDTAMGTRFYFNAAAVGSATLTEVARLDHSNGFDMAAAAGAPTAGGINAVNYFDDGVNINTIYAPIANPTFTGVVTLAAGSVGAPSLNFSDATTGFYRTAANQIGITINGTVLGAFRSTGLNLIPGTTSSVQVAGVTPALNAQGTGQGQAQIAAMRWNNATQGGTFSIGHSRSATVGTFGTALIANDQLGLFQFYGDDTTAFAQGGNLGMYAEEAWTSTANGTYFRMNLVVAGGTTNTDALRMSHSAGLQMYGTNTVIDQNRILRPRSYTIATLPTITTTGIIFCSDLGGGGANLYSNGTVWCRETPTGTANIAVDASLTFTYTRLTNASVIRANVALGAARTVTLSTTGCANGDRARFVRSASATGAFNWDIAGAVTTSLTAAKQWVDYEYDGTGWNPTAGGTIP